MAEGFLFTRVILNIFLIIAVMVLKAVELEGVTLIEERG